MFNQNDNCLPFFSILKYATRSPKNNPIARQTDLRFSPRLSENKPPLSEVRRALAPLRHLTYGIAAFNFVAILVLWHKLGLAIKTLNLDCFLLFVSAILWFENFSLYKWMTSNPVPISNNEF